MEGRLAILKVHASKVKLAEGTDLSRIARGTPGCSGADLANIVNEAALIASRAEKPGVDEDDFEAARDKVLWGKERRSRAMDDQEKRCTAFHEAGHALVAILEPEADPVHKITIIPRGMALGLTAFLPKKDKVSVTRRHLLADLAIAMGGRVEDVYDPRLPAGWKMPVLTVFDGNGSRFSTRTERNPTEISSVSSSTVSESGAVGPARTASASRTTRRTVDVRSEGTLSLQELRFGARPFWKATPWLAVRADLGLLATYSEIETTTRLSVDGAPARTIRKDDDDWTLGGYAGLALDVAATDELVFSVGAEARFPHERLHFDDGVVSGSVALAEWSAFASVGWRF